MAGSQAGFVSVPVVPTFAGMSKAFTDRLINPARKAGKQAGDAISGGLDGAVKNLEKQVKASQGNLDKLDREYEKKRRKQEQRELEEREAKKLLERAEERYNKAVEEGSKTADTAYKQLSAAKVKAKKAANNLADAQADVNSAEKKHKDQLDDYTKTLEKFKSAQDDANGALEKSKSGMDLARDGFDGIMGKASEMGGPIGGVADMLSDFKLGPAAGVAAVGGAFVVAAGELGKFSSELEDSRVDMQNQFGLSADAAVDMQGEIADALGSGIGDYETTASAVTSIAQTWGDEISHMGGQTASQLADDFMAFNQTFERSAEETASTVDVMLNSGMVASAQEGVDLLTAGMQKVPAAMQDEVFDATNEYSKFFANMGISGSDAMSMLVKASEQGQYAIDKTGDAVKEFSLKAVDPAVAETLSEYGVQVEDLAGRVARGGPEASAAMNDMVDELMAIPDEGDRATAAIAAFGTPLEDLSVDQIPSFLDGLTAGTDGMGDFEGSAQEMADNTTGTFSGMVAGWKGQIHGWAIDATLQLNEWGGQAAESVINSPVVGAFGDMFSASREKIGEFKDDAVALWGEVTSAFAGDGDGGSSVLSSIFGEENAEDILNIIADIGERFIEFKDNAVAAFEDAKEFAQPFFDMLAGFFNEQMGEVFSSIGGALGDIAGAFLEISGAVGGALWDVLLSVYDLFKELWDLLSPLLLPVLKIIAGIVGGLLVGAFLGFVGAIRVAAEIIEFLAGIIGWAVDNFLAPLLRIAGDIASFFVDGFVLAIQGFGDYFSSVFGGIKSVWDGFTDLLFVGYEFVTATVFDGIGAGLGTLRENFSTAVDAITKIWDGIKEAAAAPVRFMVNTVWNNGIIRAIDAVAGVIGMEGPDEIQLGFARGGILPGYSRIVDGDDQLVPMRSGEGVLVSEGLQDQRSRDLFMSANEQAKRGKSFGEFMTDYVAGYANGGIVGSLNSIMREFYPELQMTSHFRPGDSGYHGKNMAADFSNTGSGMPSTPAMQAAAKFMFGNYGDQLEQLIHHPARNIGSGRDVGDGFGYYGAGTMSEHTDHIHLAALKPLVDPSGVVQMMPYDGESGGAWWNPLTWAKKAWDAVVNAIAPYPDEGEGWFSQIPGNFLTSAAGKIWDWVTGKIGAGSFDGAGGTSGSAESWRDMAIAAMRRNGFNADDPAQVNAMIAQIQSESGGIPDRNQEIVDMNGTGASAGQGLLQIIPGTFADHRDPSLPDDRTDPWSNMNAALRYYKWRYGTDLTTMWGQGHGYYEGGIVDLAKHVGAKLYDVGGTLPHGGIALNQSGEDEFILKNSGMQSLGDLARAIGDLVPAVKDQTDALGRQADGMQEWMAKAADLNSIEGINARQGVRQVLDLGIDLPGADVVTGFLDAEQDIWDARQRGLKHLDAIAEKEKALADSRKALSDLQSADAPAADNSKVDEAQKKLDDAKAEQAKADSDDARAKAADKVAEAEDNLRKVREETDQKATEDAQKRADEITKANDDVTKAESELAAARKAQAADLDNIVLMSQDSILGLIPQAEGLASQLIGMGAASGAVNAGLGTVVGALGSVAAAAGPAGITLGLALSAAKAVISVVSKIVGFIKGIIEKIRAAALAAVGAMADGWETIAKYSQLLVDMQTNVSKLQQQLVRGMNEQRAAEFALRVATQDRLIAEAEGALSVAESKLALDKELEKANVAAQLRMMGLFEDWDSYKSFEAMKSQGVLDEWSDAAISALYTYEAARAEALKGEMSARLAQINAEAALASAVLQNQRNQEDLNTAQERLIRMSAKANGVDLGEATATSQVAKLVAEMAKLQQEMDKNLVGKTGAALGFDGAFSNQYRGQEAQMASLQAALDAVMQETGVSVSDSQLSKAIDQMKLVSGSGGDPMAVLRTLMPELVDAETALKIDEVMKPIDAVNDAQRDAEREVEDFENEIDLFEKTQPLEELIKGLDYQIKSLQDSSAAWADGNEELRQEYLDAAAANEAAAKELGLSWKNDTNYASSAAKAEREVTINWNGPGTEEEIQEMVDAILAGSDTKATVRKSSSEVAGSRRGVMA